MIQSHQHARQEEYRVGELDEREPPEIQGVSCVREDGEECGQEGQGVDEIEEDLEDDYGVDCAGEQALCEDGVGFD